MSGKIHYVTGDATRPSGDGPKIIVHVCNDVGGWGKGFVLAISRRWPQPEQEYRAWYRRERSIPFELGEVQFVQVEEDVWVANLIGQHKLWPINGVPPIRYEAVRSGLEKVAAFAQEHNASVHMPRIGCGLAGGTWDKIEPLIRETLVEPGVSVTVYDLPKKASARKT